MPDRLRFSVTDAPGLEGLQQEYEPFRAALEEILQTTVEFFPVEDYFMAASALQSGQVDLVWAGPSEYVAVRARTSATPIVSLVRSTYRTIIAARSDSGIQSLADLKGKTLDMWKLGSTAGQLGAAIMLMEAGLNPQTDVKAIFTEDNTLTPLKTGAAAAWARPFNRYQPAIEQEGAAATDYPIIAEGATLPGDVFVLASQLGSELAIAIQSQMLANAEKLMTAIRAVESLAERFGNGELTQGNDADYDVLREAYRAIGQGDFLQQ
ncbi:MAG: PhnD/SsuA/transferrin family substrate-binding protein [Synechococcales bacterium]|nr:PhnD/SsuA/transferrin family substrate-binding protein [Synechococcales bacterium]